MIAAVGPISLALFGTTVPIDMTQSHFIRDAQLAKLLCVTRAGSNSSHVRRKV